MGWDTETYGHDVKTSSPAFRAVVDVWSLALRTPEVSPRGYHMARGCVLPREALERGPLRAVLQDPGVVKVAHNARHDLHAAENHGVIVRGVRDTLETARLVWPARDGERISYNLKALRVSVLGKDGRDGFKALTAPSTRTIQVPCRRCVCGDPGCRRRKAPHSQVETTKDKTVNEPCPIEAITPGHPRWAAKLAYAAEDAVDALELAEVEDFRLGELAARLPELPW